MKLPWRNKKQTSVLGIEINDYGVNLTELSFSNNNYSVQSFASIAGAAVGLDKLTMLKQAIASAKTRTRCAVVAISCTKVMMKILPVDATLSDSEIAVQVQQQAQQHTNNFQSDIFTDFEALRLSEKQPTALDVRWVAARGCDVESIIELCSLAGLTVEAIDVDILAYQRILTTLSSAQLLVFFHGSIGAFFIHACAAGKIVQSHTENYSPQLLMEMNHLDRGKFVIQKLQLFLSALPVNAIIKILLSGELFTQMDYIKDIQSQISIPTHLINPFIDMKYAAAIDAENLQRNAHLLAISCGLAMRGVNGN